MNAFYETTGTCCPLPIIPEKIQNPTIKESVISCFLSCTGPPSVYVALPPAIGNPWLSFTGGHYVQ